jgi:hypothetical protein
MKSRSRFVDSFTASCLICKLAGLHFETRWISAAASLGAASLSRLEQLVSGVRGNEDQEGDPLSSEDIGFLTGGPSPAISSIFHSFTARRLNNSRDASASDTAPA